MKSLHPPLLLTALLLAAGASFTATDAQALVLTRTSYTNPAGICQSSLPVFDGVIRKRPLAVQNEGDKESFVTCAFTSPGSIKKLTIRLASNDGASHPVECTGVTGYNGNGANNQYVTKQTTVPANGAQFPLVWNVADFTGNPIFFPSNQFSLLCKLPPGSGINDSELEFNEYVGD